jgi:DNA ligase D
LSGSPAVELEIGHRRVRITNPDRIYFPARGETKIDLARYYLSVGDGIVRALRGRPCMLHRFPSGVIGPKVHQKRLPAGAPPWVQTVRVDFPSGRSADELCVTDIADVIWAVQMSTVEFHPWNTRAGNVEFPDEWRIDLDPQPGTGFEQARAVAVGVLRPLLEELGLVGYPKTSGGRGIHVFLRIATDRDFIAVRRAGIALAREVERRAPDAVTTSWWKEERGERIFIDFNQNARDRTMASAYSVRPTPIATVSTPLTWDELAGAEPDDYTIATVPDLVRRRKDPWAAIDRVSQSIAPLLELVAADEERGLGDMPYPPNYPKMPGEPKRVQPSKDRDLKDDGKRR